MAEIGKYYDLSDDITLGGNNPSDHIAVSQFAVKKGIDTIINNPFYVENCGEDSSEFVLSVGDKMRPSTFSFQYSLNNGSTWTNVTFDGLNFIMKVTPGNRIYLVGTNSTLSIGTSTHEIVNIRCNLPHKVGGDITTLLSPTGDVATIPNYCFYGLFNEDEKLINASNLVFPSVTIGRYAYGHMFGKCDHMICGPQMLRDATLGNYACISMFEYCHRLKAAPILYHQNGATGCYNDMFLDCASLFYIRTYLTHPNTSFTNTWVNGVVGGGMFYCPHNASWPTDSTSGIPHGWTKYDT